MEICTVTASGCENNKIFTPETRENCALALGNFDGVHIAHTALLEETVRVSRELGCIPAVFTFSRHSRASTRLSLTLAKAGRSLAYLARRACPLSGGWRMTSMWARR